MISNLWKGLNLTGVEGAPYYNWKQWLSEELETLLAQRVLIHTSKKVESLTLEDRFNCLSRYRIIEHGPKDIVAISDDGDRIDLNPVDRMLVAVDYRKLAESLSTACGLDSPVLVQEASFLRLGKATYPKRGCVYASLTGLEQRNLFALTTLQQQGVRDANIFLISHEQATPPIRTMAERNDWEIIPIRKFFDFSPKNGFTQKKGCCAVALSSNAAVDRWMLKRPDKPAWKHVQIRFREDDNQKVHISFGQHGRLFEHREIVQFTDKRSGAPNKQWNLLRHFAAAGGKARRIVRGRNNRNQEKIYRQHRALASALQQFFDLPDDPFKDLDGETVARFDIGMKGIVIGEKPEDIGKIFEEISSHDRLQRPAYDSDLE